MAGRRRARARAARALRRVRETGSSGGNVPATCHRRQPRQPEGRAQAAAGGGLRDQRRAHDEGRPAAQLGISGPDPRAGAPAAQLCAHARQLGIALGVRQVDSAQYNARLKSFDFDMVQWNWTASLSPGNEQINRWSSKAADIEGSLNLAGVKNPAADAMIEAMLQCRHRGGFRRGRARVRPRADFGRLCHSACSICPRCGSRIAAT